MNWNHTTTRISNAEPIRASFERRIVWLHLGSRFLPTRRMFLFRTHRKEPESSNFPVLWREIKSPARRVLRDVSWMPDTRWVVCINLGSYRTAENWTVCAVLLLNDESPVPPRRYQKIVNHLEEKYRFEESFQCLLWAFYTVLLTILKILVIELYSEESVSFF